MNLVLGGAIESDTEVGRTSYRLALAARTDNVRLPIGLLLIKSALQSAAFRNRGPGLFGSGNGGDPASLWEGNVARAPGFTFFH